MVHVSQGRIRWHLRWDFYATTDSGGHYSIGARSGHKEKVEAGFLGDQIANEHLQLQSSKASTKVK